MDAFKLSEFRLRGEHGECVIGWWFNLWKRLCCVCTVQYLRVRPRALRRMRSCMWVGFMVLIGCASRGEGGVDCISNCASFGWQWSTWLVGAFFLKAWNLVRCLYCDYVIAFRVAWFSTHEILQVWWFCRTASSPVSCEWSKVDLLSVRLWGVMQLRPMQVCRVQWDFRFHGTSQRSYPCLWLNINSSAEGLWSPAQSSRCRTS